MQLSITKLIWLGWIPIVIYAWAQMVYGGKPVAGVSHYLLQFFFLLCAMLSIGSAARTETNRKIATFLGTLAAGCGIWFLTTLLEMLEIYLRQPKYGTVADGFWIAGYLALLAGMQNAASFFGGYRSRRALRAGGLWLLFAVSVFSFLLRFARPEWASLPIVLLACFYYLADMLLIFWTILACRGEASNQMQRGVLRHLLTAFSIFYVVNLAVMLQHLTAPFHLWSAPAFSLGYFLLYKAGQKARNLVGEKI